MMLFPKPYADAVARLRVPSGFLIVIVFAWFSSPTPLSMAVGVPVSAARTRPARMGGRVPGEESGAGDRRAVCVHTESAVYRHAAGGGRAGDRVAKSWPGFAVRRCISAGVSSGDPERGAAPAEDFPGIRRLCRSGTGIDSTNSAGWRKKFESFSTPTLSHQPGISSRLGISGRDAVSPLENAGLEPALSGQARTACP